jgi:integrase
MELELQIKQLEEELEKNRSNIVIYTLLEDKIKQLQDELRRNRKKNKRAVNRDIKYLRYEEFKHLIKTIENIGDYYWMRDKLLFLIAFECGLRASEVGSIKNDDFFHDKKEMFCRRLKGSRNNTVKLTHETSILLEHYLGRYPNDSPYIFLSRKKIPITKFTLNKICKKYFMAASLPMEKAHFHTIKHTSGVHLAEEGLDIKEVQYILGHRNVDNTMIYFDFTTKQQESLYNKLGR